ncbi:MAG: YwmB family TATA-box binding protein [Syntrophomonas sp.]|nr:YwmB family TATA-box binding protein [Syntrophomonas sp.]
MKKAIVYLMIFVVICFLSDSALKYSLGKEIDNQSPYYLSFASIGANLLESRLDCWAKIKTASTNQELDEALLKILNYLELPADEKEFLHQETNETIICRYELSKDEQRYLFILQTSKTDHKSHFLMTTISSTGDLQLRRDEEKLRKLLDCKSYYLYKGSIDTRLDNAGQEELLRVVMKCLKAEVNDVYQQNQLISMTGFSPALENKISQVKVAGKNCNAQGAIRCNPKENTSEIYLGFPLLLNDY